MFRRVPVRVRRTVFRTPRRRGGGPQHHTMELRQAAPTRSSACASMRAVPSLNGWSAAAAGPRSSSTSSGRSALRPMRHPTARTSRTWRTASTLALAHLLASRIPTTPPRPDRSSRPSWPLSRRRTPLSTLRLSTPKHRQKPPPPLVLQHLPRSRREGTPASRRQTARTATPHPDQALRRRHLRPMQRPAEPHRARTPSALVLRPAAARPPIANAREPPEPPGRLRQHRVRRSAELPQVPTTNTDHRPCH